MENMLVGIRGLGSRFLVCVPDDDADMFIDEMYAFIAEQRLQGRVFRLICEDAVPLGAYAVGYEGNGSQVAHRAVTVFAQRIGVQVARYGRECLEA